MPYILLVPSILCMIALTYEDIRVRRVPRAWVCQGVLSQYLVLCAYGLWQHQFSLLLVPPFAGIVAALMQWILSRFQPGALGFGDVTASCLVGQAVGCFGWMSFLVWWLIMGVLGIVWLGIWRVCQHRSSAPFVPVITVSGLLAMMPVI